MNLGYQIVILSYSTLHIFFHKAFDFSQYLYHMHSFIYQSVNNLYIYTYLKICVSIYLSILSIYLSLTTSMYMSI